VNFPLNVYALALLAGFFASFLSLPLWRNVCRRAGLVDDPGHRKIHGAPTPLAGGLAVLTGIVAPLILVTLAAVWNVPFSHLNEQIASHGLKPANREIQIAAIVAGAVGMLVIGLLDDKLELSPALKFTGQLAVAAIVAAANVRITLFVHSAAFSYVVTILWILAVTNAFNFMDNMNGLCTGLGVIAAGCFAMIAGMGSQYLVTVVAILMTGALLGFLPHNFPKATAFLGDAGSHLVGYLLAVMAILPHFYTVHRPHVWAVFAPLLVLAIPLGDLAWVVLLRWRLGQPFYVGDNNHLSHRLVRRGFTQQHAVLLIWFAALLCGFLGVLVVL
jgi:UDP-GlcNAc:undecaprenyl-phosphate/decaprenyl-phosphate GlcNAc-1-phosphate transferase